MKSYWTFYIVILNFTFKKCQIQCKIQDHILHEKIALAIKVTGYICGCG